MDGGGGGGSFSMHPSSPAEANRKTSACARDLYPQNKCGQETNAIFIQKQSAMISNATNKLNVNFCLLSRASNLARKSAGAVTDEFRGKTCLLGLAVTDKFRGKTCLLGLAGKSALAWGGIFRNIARRHASVFADH